VFYGSVSGNEWNTVTNFEPSAVRYSFTNLTQQVTGSGLTAVPMGATLSCPYNKLVAKNASGAPLGPTVICSTGAGSGVSGIDPFPFVPPQFIIPGGPFFGFAKNFQWPYSYQLNLAVQRQVTSNLSVSAAYVGTLNHDLPFSQDINSPATGAIAPSCATSASGNITARRPIDNAGVATCATPGSPFGTVLLTQSNQTASYHGLQTTIQMRMTRGVMLYGFYTFSHTFDSVQQTTPLHREVRKTHESAPGARAGGFRYPSSIRGIHSVATKLLQWAEFLGARSTERLGCFFNY
jgi:hypothetical protein